MKKRILGQTGIEVTELCFGALPMGPLQKSMEIDQCADIVEHALKSGINFVDTAQAYRTYEPIKLAMDRTGIRPVLASKSHQKTYDGMKNAVEEALDSLGIDKIDIFHLHAAREGENAFELFADSLQCLIDMKKQGKIRAVGISTHNVKVASMAAEVAEIDVVFPIINISGRGIMGGTKEEMAAAIHKVIQAKKGVYLMKALGGGSLLNEYDAAMKYARSITESAAIAVGMVSIAEVNFNVDYFNERLTNPSLSLAASQKRIKILGACKGCGKCMSVCPAGALSYNSEHKAQVDSAKCLTCGYCTPVCPEFAIRFI